MIGTPDRQAAVMLIEEAVNAGARKACAELGLSLRTLERWARDGDVGADRRPGTARPEPVNKLTEEERAAVLNLVNEPQFAALPPIQIVPILADKGQYLASESRFYRILRSPDASRHEPRHCAKGPNELYAWDITYLPGPITGMFFFLYLVLDVFSRKIIAHEVHEAESAEHAARLIAQAVAREGIAGNAAHRAPGQRQPHEGLDFHRQAR